jgi:hypothetical protein
MKNKVDEKIVFRKVRKVDFVAESLEAEANAMPPSYKEQADAIRKEAEFYRSSDNPKTVILRIHEKPMEGDF